MTEEEFLELNYEQIFTMRLLITEIYNKLLRKM